MSDDQRPVRVRMVNTGVAAQPAPQRRRNDPAVLAAKAAAERAHGRGIDMIGAILFLVASAAGGVIVTASGMIERLGL